MCIQAAAVTMKRLQRICIIWNNFLSWGGEHDVNKWQWRCERDTLTSISVIRAVYIVPTLALLFWTKKNVFYFSVWIKAIAKWDGCVSPQVKKERKWEKGLEVRAKVSITEHRKGLTARRIKTVTSGRETHRETSRPFRLKLALYSRRCRLRRYTSWGTTVFFF